MRGEVSNCLAIEAEAAAVGRIKPRDHVDRRGLSGAVRSDQPVERDDPDRNGRVSAKWVPVFPRDKREAFARR